MLNSSASLLRSVMNGMWPAAKDVHDLDHCVLYWNVKALWVYVRCNYTLGYCVTYLWVFFCLYFVLDVFLFFSLLLSCAFLCFVLWSVFSDCHGAKLTFLFCFLSCVSNVFHLLLLISLCVNCACQIYYISVSSTYNVKPFYVFHSCVIWV